MPHLAPDAAVLMSLPVSVPVVMLVALRFVTVNRLQLNVPAEMYDADNVPVVMLDADRFETVILLASSVPVWMFVAVSNPVMIFPLEMMVVLQFDAPIESRVAIDPRPE
jgi:hypothetical protein